MILNLTQHLATTEQVKAGVVNVVDNKKLSEKLTFNSMPTAQEVNKAAEYLAALASYEIFWQIVNKSTEYLCPVENEDLIHRRRANTQVMIGGAPFLMSALEKALKAEGLCPVYAFSQRESVEVILDNGDTRKTAVFRHLGFVIM